MSRPKKCRRICDYPQTPSFVPEEMPEKGETVVLSLEEYETIRLIDREGLSQEQCGDFMQVASATSAEACVVGYGVSAVWTISHDYLVFC